MRQIISRTARFLYRHVAPSDVKNTLKLALLLDGRDAQPDMITDFSSRHVVVLAPHMDDEVAGCGGTVRRHFLAGAAISVVYMTDGRKGNPDLYVSALSPAQRAQAEDDLVLRRKGEARLAAAILGVKDLVFLDASDSELRETPAIIEKLAAILAERRPEIVYLPSLMDGHADHWATNRIFRAALQRVGTSIAWAPVIRGYEVWTPLVLNRVVDIGKTVGAKQQALEQFTSQNQHIDYVRAIISLNAYRSIYFLRGRGHAEAFFETRLEEYEHLFQRLIERR